MTHFWGHFGQKPRENDPKNPTRLQQRFLRKGHFSKIVAVDGWDFWGHFPGSLGHFWPIFGVKSSLNYRENDPNFPTRLQQRFLKSGRIPKIVAVDGWENWGHFWSFLGPFLVKNEPSR